MDENYIDNELPKRNFADKIESLLDWISIPFIILCGIVGAVVFNWIEGPEWHPGIWGRILVSSVPFIIGGLVGVLLIIIGSLLAEKISQFIQGKKP